MKASMALLGLLAAVLPAAAAPAQAAAADRAPVSRVIVGLRAEAGARSLARAGDRVQALAARSGLALRAGQPIGPVMQVVELDAPVSGTALEDTLARIASDPDVAFVEPDARVYRHAAATDPLYAGQWYLQDAEIGALRMNQAWDVTGGSPGVVIAVLDTGVRFDHPDLGQAGRGGRLLPGYDMVGPDPGGGFRLANDGDGRDANPADPGDWISPANTTLSLFAGCSVEASSWHGTRVAGMIGALTNNGTGIAGATWETWILPVRVLGKCFGNNSDILQGMRWAAGLHVEGVPDNPYPAQVINMSLGAPGACTAGYRTALAEIAGTGALVVASAGNSGGPVEYPANCEGVVGVAGIRHAGTKVGYSSLGPEVALAAPAGNCVNLSGPCLFALDTTTDTGTTAAVASVYTDQLDANIGTSFSAPQVAAIAALMLSVNGNLVAGQMRERLQEAARRPFPPPPAGSPVCHVPVNGNDIQGAECGCTGSTCGAGMADAPGSVTEALRPIVAVAVPDTVSPGQDVVLDASRSAAACGRTIASWSWQPAVGTPAIDGADTPVATVTAPASGSVSVLVTVTDDEGATDTNEVTISASDATTAAPADAGGTACLAPVPVTDPGPFVDDGPVPVAQSGGGGGGGGALGATGLALLGLALALRRRRGGSP